MVRIIEGASTEFLDSPRAIAQRASMDEELARRASVTSPCTSTVSSYRPLRDSPA
jgi:hypothetical protein